MNLPVVERGEVTAVEVTGLAICLMGTRKWAEISKAMQAAALTQTGRRWAWIREINRDVARLVPAEEEAA